MFVKITDNSQYQSDKSRTGGRYSYSETAYLNDDYEIIDGKYETSAEAPYCEKCGNFNTNHNQGSDLYEPSPEMIRAIDDIVGFSPDPGVLFSIVFSVDD